MTMMTGPVTTGGRMRLSTSLPQIRTKMDNKDVNHARRPQRPHRVPGIPQVFTP